MSEGKIRIVVVDDHPLLLSGLCLLLNAEKDMEVVGQAESAEKAARVAKELQPDILLLDVTLQDASGLDLLPRLQECSPDARVIMLTMHEDQQYLQKAMESGAKGFVLKKGLDVDLLYAIRAVARDEVYIQSSMLKTYITSQADGGREKAARDPDAQLWGTLSDRERQVVLGVVKGYTSKEIAKHYFLSEKTVATYRSRAMAKLGLNTRAELVELVFRLDELGEKENIS